MFKAIIKNDNINKLIQQIGKDRDVLKELKIEASISISHESVTLTKTRSIFHDSIKTEYVFRDGKLTKIVSFNNRYVESRRLGIYDHCLEITDDMYCDGSFFFEEKDDIVGLYNKVITANKSLKEMNGFE